LIAKYPAVPSTSAKLLVYDRTKDNIEHAYIKDIERFLPKDTAIIMNDTKVIKARLFGQKSTGAKIELLYTKQINNTLHEVLIKGRIKQDMEILFNEELYAKIRKINKDGSRIVEFIHNKKLLNFEELLWFFEKIGHIPLPPYIDREDNNNDTLTYQSKFAKKAGSVAAPTASLHFDDELLNTIKTTHNNAFVTLHIGLGTFKNVEVSDIREHLIHTERYDITPEAKEIIDSKQNILCIGTTACRSAEHYFKTKQTSGECNIFLHYNNPPQRVNHLLTNFHLPKSTLIMLVASMLGVEKTIELYNEAIAKNYRFYSYGDAMLIL